MYAEALTGAALSYLEHWNGMAAGEAAKAMLPCCGSASLPGMVKPTACVHAEAGLRVTWDEICIRRNVAPEEAVTNADPSAAMERGVRVLAGTLRRLAE